MSANALPPSPAAKPPRLSDRALALITVALALLFLGWEATGGDLRLAHWAGSPAGFALRDHWLLSGVMHRGARSLAWVLALGLCLGVRWPVGPLRPLQQLAVAQRLQLAGGVLVSALLVSVVKATNPAYCPWDLVPFGGVAPMVSHWSWLSAPASAIGHCFPAGHASAGFGFIGGWFVFRQAAPTLARRWLLAALAAGLLLGLTQQWRGAHFMSHTLWTGWLCWCIAWGLDALVRRRLAARHAAQAAAQAASKAAAQRDDQRADRSLA